MTETQITDLSRMIGENYLITSQALPVVTATLSSDAVTAIENQLVDLIDEYVRIENKHLRMRGGKDGVDIDYDRNRLSLMKRGRVLLGLSPVSETAVDSNGIRYLKLCGAGWF